MEVRGDSAPGTVAFRRGDGVVALATVRPVEVLTRGWRGEVLLPPGRWRCTIGTPAEHTGAVELASVAGPYHANVLVRA